MIYMILSAEEIKKIYQISQTNCNGCLSKSKQEVSCDLWQANSFVDVGFPER